MVKYVVQSPCTVADSLALAQNNVPAFWGETWWRLLWPGRTLDSRIESNHARMPHNLLTGRNTRRHQKVVDLESGTIVGYARWILPVSYEMHWLEAQTPDVGDDEKKLYEEQHANADFSYRDMDALDRHISGWKIKYNESNCLGLDYLAVHPDHHRRGIGSMLIQSGIKQATELGLDILVIAMGQNALNAYRKAGFELLEQKSDTLEPFGADEMYETFCLIKKV